MKKCRGCGAVSEKMDVCLTCKRFQIKWYYCSKTCQISDWQIHKVYHKSLEQSRDEQSSQRYALGSLVTSEAEADCCTLSGEDKGGTALLRAASDNNWNEVRNLILGRADPSVTDNDGLTALHYAAILGSKDLARLLLEQGTAGLIFREAPGGETSLYLACWFGHLDVAKILIKEGGAALVLKTKKGCCSCLHAACHQGHLTIVKALIEAGGKALLLKADEGGATCLHIACLKGHLSVVKALIVAGGESLLFQTRNDGVSCIYIASLAGHLDVVKALIRVGGDTLLLKTDMDRTSCLFTACLRGHLEIVRALIVAGGEALLFTIQEDGCSCLDIACHQGHLEIVKALLEAGGKSLFLKANKNGASVLFSTCQQGHLDIVKALIVAGGEASMLTTDQDGATCLHIACQKGHLGVVKALIEAGGDALVLKTNKYGGTCLLVACQEGQLEIVKALVEAGGEVLLLRTESIRGFSCLHAACVCDQVAVVDFLLSLSRSDLVGLRDHSGRTALELALAEEQAGAAEATWDNSNASANDGASIEERLGFGLVLVACRDFEGGECVFQERPVLSWRAYDRESFLQGFKSASDQTKAIILDMNHPPLAHSSEFPVVRNNLEIAKLYLRRGCSLSVLDIAKLFLICDVHCHEFQEGEKSEYVLYTSSSPQLQKAALFPKISKAAHSCDPNCVNTSSWGDGYMRLMALKQIRAGEVITHDYIACDNVPTAERRGLLKKSKCFNCMCNRCVAPDYSRGLLCIKHKCTGVTFRINDDQGPWICSKCNLSTSDNDMQHVVSKEKSIAQKLEAMQRSGIVVPPAHVQRVVEDALTFLAPSHYLCVNLNDFIAKMAITQHQVYPCNQLLETSALAGLHAVRLVECIMSCCTNSTTSCCHPPCASRARNILWAFHDLVQADMIQAGAVARRYVDIMRLVFGPEDKDVILFESMAAGPPPQPASAPSPDHLPSLLLPPPQTSGPACVDPLSIPIRQQAPIWQEDREVENCTK